MLRMLGLGALGLSFAFGGLAMATPASAGPGDWCEKDCQRLCAVGREGAAIKACYVQYNCAQYRGRACRADQRKASLKQ